MCKYCEEVFDEEKDLQALWFERKGPIFKNKFDSIINKNEKKLGVIMMMRSNCSELNIGPVLSIKGRHKNNEHDWLDLEINYCPMCGKQLRKDLIK